MSVQTHSSVPTWPQIIASVHADGSGEVSIDGAPHSVTAASIDQARLAALALVRELSALPLGRPVRLDTFDPDDRHWQLIVHPDGAVEEAERDAPATAPRPAELWIGDPAPATNPLLRLVDTSDQQPQTAAAPSPATDPVQAVTSFDRGDRPAPGVRADLAGTETTPSPVVAAVEAPEHWRAAPAPQVRLLPEPPTPPTLTDLLATRPACTVKPAQWGWQGAVRRLTAGLASPAPGADELAHRAAIATVQRRLRGPKTVVVVNPKGGAHKTTAALLIAANFGINRGGYTLAWDANETRGTMGWRSLPTHHARTATDLLHDLPRFAGINAARVGDLDDYVRTQDWGHFDVLASDEDATTAGLVDGDAFNRLHASLSCFYRVLVVDTGNNIRAGNWQAAVENADQLVVVSTIREDTAQSAAWLLDALTATGKEDLVRQAVTVLTAPDKTSSTDLGQRLHSHFGQLTRSVVSVPHDPALVTGGPIDYDRLSAPSREAWLRVTAAVADGL